MKIFYYSLICMLFLGCQHKKAPNDYLKIHQDLIKGDFYKNFIGYQIIPRDEDEYFVTLLKPAVTVTVSYIKDDSIDLYPGDKGMLIDSLSRYYDKNASKKASTILRNISDLMSFMEKESFWGINYLPGSVDKNNYAIEFFLSRYEKLRFDRIPLLPKQNLFGDTTMSIWIDSNWVYVKNKQN